MQLLLQCVNFAAVRLKEPGQEIVFSCHSKRIKVANRVYT